MQTAALPAPATRSFLIARLARHRLVIGGIILLLLAAGFAWQWSWLVAIGVAPLLVSFAPCAAMCALGLCMNGAGKRGCATARNGSAVRAMPQGSPPTREP